MIPDPTFSKADRSLVECRQFPGFCAQNENVPFPRTSAADLEDISTAIALNIGMADIDVLSDPPLSGAVEALPELVRRSMSDIRLSISDTARPEDFNAVGERKHLRGVAGLQIVVKYLKAFLCSHFSIAPGYWNCASRFVFTKGRQSFKAINSRECQSTSHCSDQYQKR
ncbi:hypothetical protein [Henriciella mobilis]|uniref:hypothetical protein n=1 Tax=Henriciella mobilis TaxID=2305467 RepID=UPI001F362B2E|nr:hypothetical protein [Henriciella mobilis]